MNYENDWCWGMHFGWWMPFCFILFILIFFFVFKYFLKEKSWNSSLNETPMEILKKRYAKGEISKEEFDQMKNDIV